MGFQVNRNLFKYMDEAAGKKTFFVTVSFVEVRKQGGSNVSLYHSGIYICYQGFC